MIKRVRDLCTDDFIKVLKAAPKLRARVKTYMQDDFESWVENDIYDLINGGLTDVRIDYKVNESNIEITNIICKREDNMFEIIKRLVNNTEFGYWHEESVKVLQDFVNEGYFNVSYDEILRTYELAVALFKDYVSKNIPNFGNVYEQATYLGDYLEEGTFLYDEYWEDDGLADVYWNDETNEVFVEHTKMEVL